MVTGFFVFRLVLCLKGYNIFIKDFYTPYLVFYLKDSIFVIRLLI